MELKPGYKQTEVGLIPEEWDCVSIQRAASSAPNAIVGGPFGSDLTSSDYVDSGVPVVRGTNMGSRMIGGSFVFVSTPKAAALSANLAGPGDVVFTQRGTLGQVSLVPDEPFKSYLISQSQMKASLDSARYNPEYVYYFFSSPQGQKQILDSAIQTGVPHTNLGICKKYIFPAPTIAEQSRISGVLADIDCHLESLDRLFEKKRQIKQAAMQELLTGKRRLPGFEGVWEVKRLGDIAEVRSGGTPSTTKPELWDGDVPWCTPTDITALAGNKYLRETARTISRAGLQASSAELIPPQSVIMTSRATIGECAINPHPITTNQGFKNLVPAQDIDIEFLYYMMCTQKAGLTAICGGSTFLEIGKKQVCNYQVFIPTARDEQTAIAAILSEMDAELASLETRRDKTRELKQGMMQELLTGRTRLT